MSGTVMATNAPCALNTGLDTSGLRAESLVCAIAKLATTKSKIAVTIFAICLLPFAIVSSW
jgi:hypothetical protein